MDLFWINFTFRKSLNSLETRFLSLKFLFMHLIRGLRISRVLIRQTFCKYLVCTQIYQLICTSGDCTEYLFSQWDRIKSSFNQSKCFSFDQSEKSIYCVNQSDPGMATILHEICAAAHVDVFLLRFSEKLSDISYHYVIPCFRSSNHDWGHSRQGQAVQIWPPHHGRVPQVIYNISWPCSDSWSKDALLKTYSTLVPHSLRHPCPDSWTVWYCPLI